MAVSGLFSSSSPLFPAAGRRRVLRALLILFGGGVLAHVWPLLQPLALAITSPLLLLTNAAVLLAVLDDERAPRLRWWCAGAWALTVTLEIVGVATGRIFGPYHYGPTLRGQVAGVPLLIGLNWVTLLLGALALTEQLTAKLTQTLTGRAWPTAAARDYAPSFDWRRPVAAAALLTGFDWVMEPVAVHLDYWQWHTWPHIPAQNYAAWFGIALGLAGGLEVLRVRVRTSLAAAYFGVQLGFFGLLRLALLVLN